jgi:hypothetical protein
MKRIIRLTESELVELINENIFSRLFGGKKDEDEKELSQEEVEKSLISLAKFEIELYQNYRGRKKYKKLIDDRSSDDTIYVDLNSFEKGDYFYKHIGPAKKYLEDNGGMVELGKYIFNLDGDTLIIETD